MLHSEALHPFLRSIYAITEVWLTPTSSAAAAAAAAAAALLIKKEENYVHLALVGLIVCEAPLCSP